MARLLLDVAADFSLGSDDSSAPAAFPPAAVAELRNGRVQPDGSVARRGGTRRLHSDSLHDWHGSFAPCYGAVAFQPTGGRAQIVAMMGDAMRYSVDNGATWGFGDLSGVGFLRRDYWSFTTITTGGVNRLICANGSATLYQWDGTTWSTLAGAASGMKYLATFNGRLYMSDGKLLYGSAILDPETYAIPDGVLLQVQTHDGEDITGLYQIASHLLVFKRSSTGYVDGFGNADLIVAAGATGFSRSVGCLAHRTIQGVGDNAVCWLSERGIEHYAPGGGITLASERRRKFFRQSVNWRAIAEDPGVPVAAYAPDVQTYHLALPTNTPLNDRVVLLSLATGALSVDRPAEVEGTLTLSADADGYLTAGAGGMAVTGDADGYLALLAPSAGGVWLKGDAAGYLSEPGPEGLPSAYVVTDRPDQLNALHGVGYDGFLRQMETGDADDLHSDGTGGTDIDLTLVTRPFLFGTVTNRKRARVVKVAGIADAASEVTVAVRADGQTGAAQTLALAATAFDQPKQAVARVSDRGRTLQVEVTTTDALRIAAVSVEAEVLREVA